MNKATGGYAFPGLNAEMTGIDSDGNERFDIEQSGGMTLRDYFAGKAIQGALAYPNTSIKDFQIPGYVEFAYKIADAMIVERVK